jgi:hypothetical protein
MDDNGWELQRWLIVIDAADTWRDPSERGPKKVSDLGPLAALLRSDASLPQGARERLADLLERHRLKPTTIRTPAHLLSESEINAQVLEEFVDEFRREPNVPHGPITKAEMIKAVKILQQRAKAEGRGHREFEGRKAATQLRQEQQKAYASYYGIPYKEFQNAILNKYGPINRRKKRA